MRKENEEISAKISLIIDTINRHNGYSYSLFGLLSNAARQILATLCNLSPVMTDLQMRFNANIAQDATERKLRSDFRHLFESFWSAEDSESMGLVSEEMRRLMTAVKEDPHLRLNCPCKFGSQTDGRLTINQNTKRLVAIPNRAPLLQLVYSPSVTSRTRHASSKLEVLPLFIDTANIISNSASDHFEGHISPLKAIVQCPKSLQYSSLTAGCSQTYPLIVDTIAILYEDKDIVILLVSREVVLTPTIRQRRFMVIAVCTKRHLPCKIPAIEYVTPVESHLLYSILQSRSFRRSLILVSDCVSDLTRVSSTSSLGSFPSLNISLLDSSLNAGRTLSASVSSLSFASSVENTSSSSSSNDNPVPSIWGIDIPHVPRISPLRATFGNAANNTHSASNGPPPPRTFTISRQVSTDSSIPSVGNISSLNVSGSSSGNSESLTRNIRALVGNLLANATPAAPPAPPVAANPRRTFILQQAPKSPPRPTPQDLHQQKFASALSLMGFEFIKGLGSGGFGEVFSVKPKQQDCPIKQAAIKFSNRDYVVKWMYVQGERVPDEVVALKELQKLKVVPEFYCHGEWKVDHREYIVICMEQPEKCEDLYNYAIRKKGLSSARALMFFKKIVLATCDILRLGWVHTDLKPDNILVCDDKEIKIIDFGLAAKPYDGKFMSHSRGTMNWNVPPEWQAGEYDEVDGGTVWSLGVILYYMLFIKLPFDKSEEANTSPLRFPSKISTNAERFLKVALKADPKERITLLDLEKMFVRNSMSSNSRSNSNSGNANHNLSIPPYQAPQRTTPIQQPTMQSVIPPPTTTHVLNRNSPAVPNMVFISVHSASNQHLLSNNLTNHNSIQSSHHLGQSYLSMSSSSR